MSCERPGCTGEIQDGYCNVCGMAPRSGSAQTSQPPAPSAAEASRAAPSNARESGSGTDERPTGAATAAASTAVATSTAGSGTRRGRRAGATALGAGLVEIPPIPYRDPREVVMSEPMVSESRRFCVKCRDPVGRGRDGAPGRTEGFCRTCGTPFSFAPKLVHGETVAGQYEVVGCLAHGGLGWIYLASDHAVADRWVVLKGLLDSGDRDAMAAAIAERRFLAEVEHPNIVKIFNFVEQEGSGYIVMEYVGGRSLKDLLAIRREESNGESNPLPLAQAIAHVLGILPALGYLHGEGLLFCDLKPENVIQTRDSLKLIDLGGVYRLDDEASPVYGTVGYQAPEIARTGPSISSDLFTAARTLAVLCTDFRGYQSTFKYSLPPQETVPLYAEHDSLYRLLERATAQDPSERFQSAQEMADQLHGVLCEVVAAEEGTPAPFPSVVFTGEVRAQPDAPDWRFLPTPLVSPEDPAAGYLATITTADPQDVLELLSGSPETTVEIRLRRAHTMIDLGETENAERELEEILADDPWEWRARWFRGISELAQERPGPARQHFDAVSRNFPGELAPKLALAVSYESAQEPAPAAALYDVVSRTDPGYTTASFGLARCFLAQNDWAGACSAYDRVPESSSSHVDAQTRKAQCLLGRNGSADSDLASLDVADHLIKTLPLDSGRRASMNVELLSAALFLIEEGLVEEAPDRVIASSAFTERAVRLQLESLYRVLARAAETPQERVQLVDWANEVRPWTWT
jgi:serine/threonine-protein kinase PknG